MDRRRLFNRKQLSDIYRVGVQTIPAYIGDVLHVATDEQGAYLWDIGTITTLTDKRPKTNSKKDGTWSNQWGSHDPDDDEHIETNPDRMKAAERRLWYQSEDLRQSTLLKERKNAVEARDLIPAHEVELTLAGAFKAVTLMLDTLPDALERDGVIPPEDIGQVISILDSAREQLSNDLLESNMEPVTELLKMMVSSK